jgi:hypothetical protein
MEAALDDAPIRRTGSRVVYASPWMTVREDDIEYADGTTSVFGVVAKKDFALVLPRADGGFWLVNQYRYPIQRRAWEFPQGGWPAGHDGTPADLARAELAEETGLTAGRLTHLGRLNEAHGFCTQAFDVFLAEDLVEGAPAREATESDMVHAFVTDAELNRMIREGQIGDGPTLAALTLYRLHTTN